MAPRFRESRRGQRLEGQAVASLGRRPIPRPVLDHRGDVPTLLLRPIEGSAGSGFDPGG